MKNGSKGGDKPKRATNKRSNLNAASKKSGTKGRATYTPSSPETSGVTTPGGPGMPTVARQMGTGIPVMRANPENKYGKPHGHILKGTTQHAKHPVQKKTGAVRVENHNKATAARKKK